LQKKGRGKYRKAVDLKNLGIKDIIDKGRLLNQYNEIVRLLRELDKDLKVQWKRY
jgi:hypothetical protein